MAGLPSLVRLTEKWGQEDVLDPRMSAYLSAPYFSANLRAPASRCVLPFLTPDGEANASIDGNSIGVKQLAQSVCYRFWAGGEANASIDGRLYR